MSTTRSSEKPSLNQIIGAWAGRYKWWLIGLSVVIIIVAGISVLVIRGRRSRDMKSMETDLGAVPVHIAPIATDLANEYNLRDFYVASSLNSCCSGSGGIYTYVGQEPLKRVIAHGARALDFEIFSVDGVPVISTSIGQSEHIKATINSLSFDDAMKTVARYAFSSGGCQNSSDPLIVNLRMSTNMDVYDSMAKSLTDAFGSHLLHTSHPTDSDGESITQTPMASLVAGNGSGAKVIVICTGHEAKYQQNQKFYDLVSASGNSPFIRNLSHYDVLYGAGNEPELRNYNKKNMSMVLPRPGEDTSLEASIPMQYGCQLVFMDYSQPDTNFELMSAFFNEAGSAFKLKPKGQRLIPTTIKAPPPQNPDLSYSPQTISKPYFSAKI